MEALLARLNQLDEEIVAAGKRLFGACDAALYPCDALALAVANRALSLSNGFSVLMKNCGYIAAAGIIRMQLDNVLRLHGVTTAPNPHETANLVIGGAALKDIKNSDGKKMADAVLRESISASHPWVDRVYKLSSGYIHLSEQHVLHLMQRSPLNADGHRDLTIGSEDEHLRVDQQEDLVETFLAVTGLVIDAIDRWTQTRSSVSTLDELRRRWPSAA